VGVHLFVDESRRGSTYLLVAALIEPAKLADARTLMRDLRMPGERRIHFQAEHDTRRRKILSALAVSGVGARVYLGIGRPDRVRAGCLDRLVADAVECRADRLVLESRGGEADRTDRAAIHRILSRSPRPDRLVYEHLCPHEDPALAVADAIAWAHGAGGDWRRRVEQMVETVVDIGPR
jgi:hypothetical protein